jgi:hypothetical protein
MFQNGVVPVPHTIPEPLGAPLIAFFAMSGILHVSALTHRVPPSRSRRE